MHRWGTGGELTREEAVSFARRMQAGCRRIVSLLSCMRLPAVSTPTPSAPRPPVPPRPAWHYSGGTTWTRPPPPDQPGGSTWTRPPPRTSQGVLLGHGLVHLLRTSPASTRMISWRHLRVRIVRSCFYPKTTCNELTILLLQVLTSSTASPASPQARTKWTSFSRLHRSGMDTTPT